MINLNRRKFLGYGSAAVAGSLIEAPGLKALGFVHPDGKGYSHIEDEKVRKLSKIAVDAAMSAGATYVDVRLTYTKDFTLGSADMVPGRSESIGIGIRSLSGGYWGFSSSPVWNESEAARLGKSATANAIANKSKAVPPIELSGLPDAAGGSWVMPVQIDPFGIPHEEIVDYIGGMRLFISRLEKVLIPTIGISFSSQAQEKYFFSSNNQYIYQKLYNTSGRIAFRVADQVGSSLVDIDSLTPAGVGAELIKNSSIRDYIKVHHQEALQEMQLGALPVDVGRYQVLLNRSLVASLASQSIGLSTELDRALGFEANASGTSFINSPEEMLGTLSLASPLINISASRSDAGSVSRVEWDDEGVRPISIDVIKEGKLVGLQAPREGYSWMKEYHAKRNTNFAPTGSVNSASGINSPLVFSSDLKIEADDKNAKSIDDLRADIKDGLEFKVGDVSMDFQLSTGLGIGGSVFKIQNGRRVARIINAGSIFRTSNLWKSVMELGGSKEVLRFGFPLNKGEPAQTCYHSVYAPHMVVKEMDVIDITRKA